MIKKVTNSFVFLNKFANSHSLSFYFVTSLLLSFIFALSSQVYFILPFNFIPITLQTFVIFLSSILFGKIAFMASIFWVFEGIAGFPAFFGAHSGFSHICGPTGGYIIGFILATGFLSLFKNAKSKNFLFNFLTLFLGLIILHLFGVLQLSFFVPLNLNILLFFFVDIVKILLITLIIFMFNRNKLS